MRATTAFAYCQFCQKVTPHEEIEREPRLLRSSCQECGLVDSDINWWDNNWWWLKPLLYWTNGLVVGIALQRLLA